MYVFSFLVSGQPQKNHQETGVFAWGLMDWKKRVQPLDCNPRGLPRPRSGKVIGEQFSYCMTACNNFHFSIFEATTWTNALVSLAASGQGQTNDLCAPSSLRTAALAAVLFRDLARWKKAYVLQGIVKDQPWKKNRILGRNSGISCMYSVDLSYI